MTDQTPSEAPATYNVFVYGSLRPGLYNFPMAKGGLVAEPRAAVIHGFTLHANHSDSYPFLARGVEEGASGNVVGEVLTMEAGYHLMRIVQMEEGAGYRTEFIEADVEQYDGTIEKETVVAFVHRDEHKTARGTIVPDGNWVPYYEAAEARYNAPRRTLELSRLNFRPAHQS